MIESKNFTFDKIIPFTLKKSKIRGRFVKLDQSISKILNRHNYELPISLILAEILSVSCCIGSLLKFNGNFTIQGSSKEILKTVLADYSSNGSIRAYASYDKSDFKSNILFFVCSILKVSDFASLIGFINLLSNLNFSRSSCSLLALFSSEGLSLLRNFIPSLSFSFFVSEAILM